MKALVAQVVSNSLQPHGLQPTRLLCPRDSPGKNTGVGYHSLLQEIFLTQGLILYRLSHQQSPKFLCLFLLCQQILRFVLWMHLRPALIESLLAHMSSSRTRWFRMMRSQKSPIPWGSLWGSGYLAAVSWWKDNFLVVCLFAQPPLPPD